MHSAALLYCHITEALDSPAMLACALRIAYHGRRP